MEEVKQAKNDIAKRIRKLFIDNKKPFTLAQINEIYPDLKPTQISMALCYLMRNRYLSREQVPNEKKMGRKSIYVYTYHESKLPKEVTNAN